MIRILLLLTHSALLLPLAAQTSSSLPQFDYETAQAHEIKPHRRSIPTVGILYGSNQLHLRLTVSSAGDVVQSEASGSDQDMQLWPEVQDEVNRWNFTPFEIAGKAITAEVDEYVDLVPPEQVPLKHVKPPILRPSSTISIKLSRSGCYGSCPAYNVTVSTNGIFFNGSGYTVALGHHVDKVDAGEVRKLAKKIVEADFFSMEDEYSASITDSPTYILSISIDNHQKKIVDYVGVDAGMPEVIVDLEEAVDQLARTKRWTQGEEGLVDTLKAEHYNFQTYEAQTMLKAAASRGQTDTVRELLAADVPLKLISAPKAKESSHYSSFQEPKWLESAATRPSTLETLIDAGVSKDDQMDKDQALVAAADAGNLESFRDLVSYGANPKVDPVKLTITEVEVGMSTQGSGRGSLLTYGARSGNPDMVREILRNHPDLEARDPQGKTALFAAGDYRSTDKDGNRVECVRLLLAAGADVNARDNNGDTPLHETFLTDVEEELIGAGANVNARNNDGETPIFTTIDDKAIPLFLAHGADVNIRNNKGQTAVEAAETKGPLRQEALKKAIEEHAASSKWP